MSVFDDNNNSELSPTLMTESGDVFVSNTWLASCDFWGLFTKRKFVKGDVVCIYTGDIHRTIPALRLKNKSYLMRLGEQCYVDAQPHSHVFARYYLSVICFNAYSFCIKGISTIASIQLGGMSSFKSLQKKNALEWWHCET